MHDDLPDRDADLIRAAEAAASWARARRATWTTVPASRLGTVPDAAPPEESAGIEAAAARPEFSAPDPSPRFRAPEESPVFVHPEEPPSYTPTAPPPAYAPMFETERSAVSASDRLGALVRAVPPIAIKGAALAAGVVVLGMAAFYGGRAVWRSLPTSSTAPKTAPAEPAAAGRASAAAGRKGTGSLRVTTTPAGARVTVDGKPHGVTPVTVSDLTAGSHEVALESNAGTVRRTVTVSTSQTAQLEESIFSGWLAVFAPFEIVISEANRVLRPDERGQILLPPGLHDLRVSNRTLGYEATWNVEIKPGETTNLRVTPEPSRLSVTSPEPAEVWVDGAKVGDTPVNAAPVPLGTHDVLVKRASGAERHYTITVGVKPFTLNADFR